MSLFFVPGNFMDMLIGNGPLSARPRANQSNQNATENYHACKFKRNILVFQILS